MNVTGTAIRVIFENDDVLAVDKPEGIVSIGEAGKGGLPELLRERFAGKLYPVHRLDKEVSGVILYAKNAEAHRFLNAEFERREAKKTYVALVHGAIEQNRGVISAPIREFGSGRMGVDRGAGKPAATEFKVYRRIKGGGEYTLVRAYPATGRRHQIRVHLYSIGHPIVGDRKYGEKAAQEQFPRLMLHALSLEITLPGGNRLTIEAPPSESFTRVLEGLQTHPRGQKGSSKRP